MTLAGTSIPATPVAEVSERVRQRLEALGAVALSLQPDGGIRLHAPGGPLEQALAQCRPLRAELARRFDDLAATNGQAAEVWPELWLLRLPAPRRRRLEPGRPAAAVPAALLVGPAFLDSDQFRLLCSSGGLDVQALAAQVDRGRLWSRAEVQRLSGLVACLQQDDLEIAHRQNEIQTLSQQLAESYEELSLLYKLSTGMTLDRPPAAFLTEACMELQQVAGLKWLALQLVDDQPTLNELSGQVFVAGPVGCDPAMLQRIGRQLMLRRTPASPPLVVDDTQTLQIPALPRLARSLLVVPLVKEDRLLGLLFGGDKNDGQHISSIDVKLCNSLAASLSMFLENMMLYEDTAAMFMGTLHALTASIDAKDRYTHGHSERVAWLSQQLAGAAGLDAAACERIYIAGLVHDVGKIGVPEAVLRKAGKLTDAEFALIRAHPEIGARILQDIRQMQDVIPGVLHHHERWDGRGYPAGLQGERIPLFGRLIGLADSFDAMSSTRTYRSALSVDHVLAEIQRCAGTQFDPRLAGIFLTLDFEPYARMVLKHQSASYDPCPQAEPAAATPEPAP